MSEVELNMQVRSSSASSNTDERTNVTKKVVAEVSHLRAVDARRGEGTFADDSDPANPFGWAGRHAVVRRGPREPIASHIRSAVWYRDKGLCSLCIDSHLPARPWELDHVIPWSAGGSDSSTNLRVLCLRHNQERSNWQDSIGKQPTRGVTWWCINCYSHDEAWNYHGRSVECPTCDEAGRHCRVMLAYLHFGDEIPTWHQRQPIDHARHLAYCAHCDAPGMTDVVL